ncbi:MAG: Holliday junction branch migration protein RuvA, partial [Candidatus Obscuribacterales bacterium]|nr:Holliday junction branch migration protein RuvA [Candidatus Obscuribacterales bacterium]
MFAFLKGVVHSKELMGGQDDRLVLDVSGVGFDIRMAPASLLAVAAPGEVALIHTWLCVRENDLTIFGFETVRQRKLFQALLKVTGVGPKMALSITGTLGVNQLIDAIAREDTKTISQAPGVGKKVAERVVLELKSKL